MAEKVKLPDHVNCLCCHKEISKDDKWEYSKCKISRKMLYFHRECYKNELKKG